ncbi:MAG: small subunit ribosomal protein S11 [Parcubacteria group bacterium Gr01-1014_3]|nr:MAG: small subunit ribosomal protein S11 [Parcubacteria group bacterium Gr01-1014_3]
MPAKKATTEVKEVKDKKAPEQAEVKAVAEETVAVESKISKKLDKGRVYVKASYNNTLISITDEKGNLIAWSSAGSLGFAGPKKATPFAASKIIAALAEKVKKSGPLNVSVFVSGVGGGRDSAIRSLANQGFNILSIKDVTPIPHNGPKPPKVRRV